MAGLLVHYLATRPILVWSLSLLPRWVVMCTALMRGSGLFLLKRGHQPLQGGEQGEEELLLMQEEEGARRDEGRKEKKAALGPEVVLPPTCV